MVAIASKPLRDPTNGKPVCRIIELPVEGRTTMDATALINSDGQQVGLAGVGPDGRGYVALVDQNGMRASVTIVNGEPVLAVLDEAGNITHIVDIKNLPPNTSTKEQNHG